MKPPFKKKDTNILRLSQGKTLGYSISVTGYILFPKKFIEILNSCPYKDSFRVIFHGLSGLDVLYCDKI